MPRKERVPKERFEEISDTALWILSDGEFGTDPGEHSWEAFKIQNDFMHGDFSFWNAHKSEILSAWIRERPGLRPALWWRTDAPRISEDSIGKMGRGAEVARLHPENFCEPRKRLAGTGVPIFEALNYWPIFLCGVPASWVSMEEVNLYPENLMLFPVDPSDPPKFESQASYLKRHNLFEPGEERRLKAKDFEPQIIFEEETLSDEKAS